MKLEEQLSTVAKFMELEEQKRRATNQKLGFLFLESRFNFGPIRSIVSLFLWNLGMKQVWLSNAIFILEESHQPRITDPLFFYTEKE